MDEWEEWALQTAHTGMHSERESMWIPVQTQARPNISVDRRDPPVAKKPPATESCWEMVSFLKKYILLCGGGARL